MYLVHHEIDYDVTRKAPNFTPRPEANIPSEPIIITPPEPITPPGQNPPPDDTPPPDDGDDGDDGEDPPSETPPPDDGEDPPGEAPEPEPEPDPEPAPVECKNPNFFKGACDQGPPTNGDPYQHKVASCAMDCGNSYWYCNPDARDHHETTWVCVRSGCGMTFASCTHTAGACLHPAFSYHKKP